MIAVFIALVILMFVLPKSSKTKSNGPTINFCNRGMDGHNDRVAEFYGYDSYKEMLKADGIDIDKIEEDIKNGKIKIIQSDFHTFFKMDKQ